MSESKNIQANNSVKAETGERKLSFGSLVMKYWWLPSSYLVPYFFTRFFCFVSRADETMARCEKVSLIGLVCAVLIYALWRLDCRFGARQPLEKSSDRQGKILVYLFGMALWVTWLSAGIIMGMVYEQVHELAPQLPGLSSPL